MSVRVVRWDTGREHEIPEEALRWGPDTKQGTCRAALLLGGRRASVPLDVPYVLPFEGAKWAVRVTLTGNEILRANDPGWIGDGWKGRPRLVAEGRGNLGSLLDAAAEALRAETGEDRPSAPGEALEVLAACLPLVEELRRRVGDKVARRRMADLLHAGYRLLERETSAEIRREWKGVRRV